MRITNWDTWQTFRKDRGTPPWIKVYRNLLSNAEWVSLSDAEKGQLVSIWLLAADKDGKIPDDPMLIKRMAMLDLQPNLNKFIELGFMTGKCQPDGNQMVTTCPQVDAPEKRQSRSEKSKDTGQNEFDLWWNEYPKKVKKKESLKIWKRTKPDTQTLIADTQNRIQNDSNWLRGFVPDPTTYLNGERWNDELNRKPSNGTGRQTVSPGTRNREAGKEYFRRRTEGNSDIVG